MSDFDDEPTVAADANDDQPDLEPEAGTDVGTDEAAVQSEDTSEPDLDLEPEAGTDEGADEAAVDPEDTAMPESDADLEDAPEEAPVAQKSKRSEPDDDWDDDWDDEDDGRGGGKRDLTLVYAIVAAAIVIVLAVVLTRPKDDGNTPTPDPGAPTTAVTAPPKNWQGPVGDAVGEDGKNAQARAEAAAGVYIWTDFQGWHVRSNNGSEVTVTVAADQVRQKKTDDYDDGDESGDAAFVTEAVVKLPAGDGKTGAGFDLGTSESATFTVVMDGKNVAPGEIKLGGAEGQADANPITFIKG